MKESQAWLVPFFGHSLLGRNDSLQPLGSTLDDQLSSSSWRLHRERATDSSPAAHRLTRGVVQYVTDTSLSSKLQCWPTYLRFLTTAQSIQLFVDSSCWVIALRQFCRFSRRCWNVVWPFSAFRIAEKFLDGELFVPGFHCHRGSILMTLSHFHELVTDDTLCGGAGQSFTVHYVWSFIFKTRFQRFLHWSVSLQCKLNRFRLMIVGQITFRSCRFWRFSLFGQKAMQCSYRVHEPSLEGLNFSNRQRFFTA